MRSPPTGRIPVDDARGSLYLRMTAATGSIARTEYQRIEPSVATTCQSSKINGGRWGYEGPLQAPYCGRREGSARPAEVLRQGGGPWGRGGGHRSRFPN